MLDLHRVRTMFGVVSYTSRYIHFHFVFLNKFTLLYFRATNLSSLSRLWIFRMYICDVGKYLWLISNNLVNALVCRDMLSHHHSCLKHMENVCTDFRIKLRLIYIRWIRNRFDVRCAICIRTIERFILLLVCFHCFVFFFEWNKGALPIIHWLIDFLSRVKCLRFAYKRQDRKTYQIKQSKMCIL